MVTAVCGKAPANVWKSLLDRTLGNAFLDLSWLPTPQPQMLLA